MNEELKDLIKRTVVEHLKRLGWPNVENPDTLIFENLEPLYDDLRKRKLIPEYFTLQMFKTVAIKSFLKVANERQKARRVYPI